MKTILFLLAFILPVQTFASGTPDGDTQMRSVSSERANVRSGPGADYEVAWEAGRFYPLEVLGREGAWVRVSDYEKEEGWIHSSLLANAPAVVVVTKMANIREGAGMDYEVSWRAEKECSMKVLQTDGNWYKVSDGEEELGWIHGSVVWGFSGGVELEEQAAG